MRKETTLQNGMLVVAGELTDIFKVELNGLNRNDLIIEFVLIPNEETKENGVDEVHLDFDCLNETIPEVLKENGYTIVDSKYF